MEPTGSNNLGIKAFLDRPRKSSGEIADIEAAKNQEDLGTAGPQRGSKASSESMHMVRRGRDKREKGKRNGWMLAGK